MDNRKCSRFVAILALVALLFAAFPAMVFAGEDVSASKAAAASDLPAANTKYGVTPIDMNIVDIASGRMMTLALDGDGTVWAWGYNQFGMLGNGEAANESILITQVTLPQKAVSVAVGLNISLALLEDGTVAAWGPDSPAADKNTPTVIEGLENIVQITAGHGAFAVSADGHVWSWGSRTDYGLLGQGHQNPVEQPTQIQGLENVVKVFAAYNSSTTFAKLADGTVMGWGRNFNRELGLASPSVCESPVVTPYTGAVNIIPLYSATLVLKSNGQVQAIGYDLYGQFGKQSRVTYTSLTTIQSNVSALGVAGASSHIGINGNMWSAGVGGFTGIEGQKLDSAIQQPFRQNVISDVAAITTGFHAFAQTTNGDWYAWGHAIAGGGLIPNNDNAGAAANGYVMSPVMIFRAVETEDFTHEVTVTKTWADDARQDIVTVHEVLDGEDMVVTFDTPAGYTAHVSCQEVITVDYDAGTIDLSFITGNVDIVITYTPISAVHTVTVREAWADGANADRETAYTVQPGSAVSINFATPAGYTAEVTSARALSVNYDAGRIYAANVVEDFEVFITYTPEEPGNNEPAVTVRETWADGSVQDRVTTYPAEIGRAISINFATPAGYTAVVTSDMAVSVNLDAGRIYLGSVPGSFEILITYSNGETGGGGDEDDSRTITVTEVWADGSQPDKVATYTVESGKAASINFATPAGYTAVVTSGTTLSVNYDAGRIYAASVTQDFAISIVYTAQ